MGFLIKIKLINPIYNGLCYDKVQKMIFDTITPSTKEHQSILCENIILVGGSSMFDDLSQRLKKEKIVLAPPETKIYIIAIPECKYSSFNGSCIFGSLIVYPSCFLSINNYKKEGVASAHILVQNNENRILEWLLFFNW